LRHKSIFFVSTNWPNPFSCNTILYVLGNPVNLGDTSGMIADYRTAIFLNGKVCGTNSGLVSQTEDPCRFCQGLEYTFCSLGLSGPCAAPPTLVPTPTVAPTIERKLPQPILDGCKVVTPPWDDPVLIEHNNCYSYAVNIPQRDGFTGINPGSLSGQLAEYVKQNGGSMQMTCEFWSGALKLDGIEKVENTSECASRCTNGYPIYLVVDPGNDYHFYRMDAPGVWTGKLGGGPYGPVLACDGSDNRITDPSKANHNYKKPNNSTPINGRTYTIGFDYSDSCGYFCVCPEKIQALQMKSGSR
jgi:hypothetical protein